MTLTLHKFVDIYLLLLQFQDLEDTHKHEFLKLEAVISKLKQELLSEERQKYASENEAKRLEDECDLMRKQMQIEGEECKNEISVLKKDFRNKIVKFKRRSEKIAAENFECAMENVS